MNQGKLIELVAIFRQNNTSYNYGQSDLERNVSESLPLVEALVNALHRNGVDSETIQTSLKQALAPHCRAEDLPRDSQARLIKMIETFHQNNPHFSYQQSDYTRSVHESLSLTEVVTNALRRNLVDGALIEKSLKAALAPHYPAQRLSHEKEFLLIHSGLRPSN